MCALVRVHARVCGTCTQSCPTVCDPMDCQVPLSMEFFFFFFPKEHLFPNWGHRNRNSPSLTSATPIRQFLRLHNKMPLWHINTSRETPCLQLNVFWLWWLLCCLLGQKLIPESHFLTFQLLGCPSVDTNLKVPFFLVICWPVGKPLPIRVPETESNRNSPEQSLRHCVKEMLDVEGRQFWFNIPLGGDFLLEMVGSYEKTKPIR